MNALHPVFAKAILPFMPRDNAITPAEAKALAWTHSNPFKAPELESEPAAVTLHDRIWEMAEDDFLSAENIGGWIESASTERQQSVYWGLISTAELVYIIFSRPGEANAEQIEQARITFRRRFFAEHTANVAELADRLSIGADSGLREVRT